MKKFKHGSPLISIVLAAVMLVSLSISPAALSSADTVEIDGHHYRVFTGTQEEIQPRLKCFSSVFATVAVYSSSVSGAGNFTPLVSEKITFTVSLEKNTSNSASGWSSTGKSTVENFTNLMPGDTQLTSVSYANPPTNYYRTNATAVCKNSSNIILEQVTAHSPAKRYPATRAASDAGETIYEVYQLVE